ncbi:MAG: choice-of-anchor L domain-containing protein [Flavobacteriales bacterium]|nr:choice-of-anchor L domain-containing protein [Flavobacteriales bacterium]
MATLTGPGIIYSNVFYNGDPNAIGVFTNGSSTNLGLNSGVVMSTGLLDPANAASFAGPASNFISGQNGGTTYPELNSIAGATTYDGLVLEFDFVPLSNQINVEYVFGSEEYNEWVNSGYNDAFAFFISGPGIVGQQNIALVPGTSLPVTIDNINNGNWGGCAFGPCYNCAYFVDNCTGNSLAMDAFTTVLTATATVIPCSTYHIRLMIADGGDEIYDSWVFIKQDGLYSPGGNTVTVTSTTLFPGGTAYEACGIDVNYFTFSLASPAVSNITISFTVGGTAINGVDYQAIPNSITIPAGQTSANLYINALPDGITEGLETVTITLQNSVCGSGAYTLQIGDTEPLTVSVPPNISLCAGGTGTTITATATGGYGNITYNWDNGAGNTPTISVNPAVTTTYTVTVSDQCGQSASAQTTVSVGSPPTADFNLPATACVGQSVDITYTGTGQPTATYQWDFGGGTVLSGSGQGPYQVSWPVSGQYAVSLTVTEAGCPPTTTVHNIVILSSPTAFFTASTPVCVGQNSTITYTGNAGAAAQFMWNFAGGSVQSGSAAGPYQVSWNTAGNYTISLQVIENGCASQPFSQTVTVNASPSATFTITTPICAGQATTITYTGNGSPATAFNWNFGGGQILGGASAGPYQVAYNQPGQVSISLAVSENGCTSQPYVQNLTVLPLPQVNIVAPPPQCLTGNSFDFTVQGSWGPTAVFQWSFPGGSPATSSAQNPQNITWNQAGVHPISLFVNDNGCQAQAQASVEVWAEPVPSFTLSPPSGCAPLTVQFTSTSTGAPPLLATWNFGNGESGAGLSPSVVYTDHGTYSVTLMVTDGNGCSASVQLSDVVAVYPSPEAGFSAHPPVVDLEDAHVVITDNSLYATQWFYTFGDGWQSTEQNPSHLYQSEGLFTITQIVRTPFGCTDTATAHVLVNPVTEVFIPTAFTPDGNNHNEVWRPVLSYIRDYKVWIFDRWGQVVYYSEDVYEGWNGRYMNRGSMMKQDTYVYLIQFRNYANKLKTVRGAVTLIR